MNRLISLLLGTLIACPAAQAAVAITTNPVCKKLVTAIEQAQKVESCKAAWQKITKSPAIKVQDHTQIIQQALRLAQVQKEVFEEELTNLDDETKDRSKIKWGRGQLALGSYFVAGAPLVWMNLACKGLGKNKAFDFVATFFFPESLGIQKDPTTGKDLNTSTNSFITIIFVMHLIIDHLVGPYLIYRGYRNLKQGLNHKQILQDKISNLDAIITYLQDLQTKSQ